MDLKASHFPVRLGRYQLEALIGSGAYAHVYRATDTILPRTVALKVLKPSLLADEEAFARFLDEAKAAAGLFHPAIATVLDLGQVDGNYFLAMRYVDGTTLDQLIELRGGLPWAEALRIAEQIAAALDFAHSRGLVHRDVKPQNIMVSVDEGAVLTDFGLVRALESGGLTSLTGAIIGTPQYIPPEVWRRSMATPAADQYALACVLVEMLSGKVLFSGPTPWAIMAAHASVLNLPDGWPPGAPPALTGALKKALDQEPSARFENCAQFIAGLQTVAPPAAIPQMTVSNPNEIAITLAPGVEMVFVHVPAGEFWMGAEADDPQASTDELPPHPLTLSEYWIGKYPVTQRQFRAYLEASARPGRWKVETGKEEHPVVHVNWPDALAFCRWASQVSGAAIRLPSEAEWEKAARSSDRRMYPWGNQPPTQNLANSGRIFPGVTPVGYFSPQGDSPYGCADMCGNVWEWVSSLYAGYPYKPQDGREDLAIPGSRVLRGGSMLESGGSQRLVYRNRLNPVIRFNINGFRCALTR